MCPCRLGPIVKLFVWVVSSLLWPTWKPATDFYNILLFLFLLLFYGKKVNLIFILISRAGLVILYVLSISDRETGHSVFNQVLLPTSSSSPRAPLYTVVNCRQPNCSGHPCLERTLPATACLQSSEDSPFRPFLSRLSVVPVNWLVSLSDISIVFVTYLRVCVLGAMPDLPTAVHIARRRAAGELHRTEHNRVAQVQRWAMPSVLSRKEAGNGNGEMPWVQRERLWDML